MVASREVMSGEFKSAHNASLYAGLKDKLRSIPTHCGDFVTICAASCDKPGKSRRPDTCAGAFSVAMRTTQP